ncbi:effector-associated domain EAD1-containing protein [Polyangium mundeleinium]|uniref:Effector-associated domain EAD1-containing protein n=1 Tax=Polyangium mundeleinium TaxID=2995306 RepID=A0ABT5ES98_9BACT|nr:effector-associated domain EAD1-containing protein [Polyangium mundeleinium]MDC0744694.1 effector-associated domain EAD1-containing protein [Polyangium mundeleinium]
MVESGANCTFEGEVGKIHVFGVGRAVVLDPAVFRDGHTDRVNLTGALDDAWIGDSRSIAGLDPIQPNPKCKQFDVTYKATAGAGAIVTVAQGGEPGWFIGKTLYFRARDCSARCRVERKGEMSLEISRRSNQAVQLAGPIPIGREAEPCTAQAGEAPLQVGVERLVLSTVSGSLRCGDEEIPLEGDWVFSSGPARSLLLEWVKVRGPWLVARVTNEVAPSPVLQVRFPTRKLSFLSLPRAEPVPWTHVSAIGGAVLLLVVLAALARRKRSVNKGKPIELRHLRLSGSRRKELHAALLDAFRGYDQLAIMVRHELDKNLEEVASSEKALDVVVHKLLDYAEAQGRMGELIHAARAEKPGNERLAEVAKKLGVK